MIEEKENIKIENMIYEVRGKQVMLDSDLAKLYECANGTKDINKAVKRNIERFPADFYFQLTREEISRFQIGTLNKAGRGYNIKYLPYVFTEQGVAMLSSVLKTVTATKVSINIMRAFVSMRHFILENKDIIKSINNIHNRLDIYEQKLINHDDKFNILFDKFVQDEIKEEIYFEGQTYDAYSLLIDILKSAKKEIIIIDNYIDKKFLDVCSKINVNILIITNKINEIDLEKYNKQYNNIEIKISKSYHDRFIILDKKVLYHCGASFKDLGKKCFAINLIENDKILKKLLEEIKI